MFKPWKIPSYIRHVIILFAHQGYPLGTEYPKKNSDVKRVDTHIKIQMGGLNVGGIHLKNIWVGAIWVTQTKDISDSIRFLGVGVFWVQTPGLVYYKDLPGVFLVVHGTW